MDIRQTRNAALEEAAELVRNHAGETFVGIGGNPGWRKASQVQLADAILALRTPSASRAAESGDELPTQEVDARRALAGLRDAMKAGITLNDEPHRVILSDGSVVEGQAAFEWRALMVSIIDLADGVLGQTKPWRAYPGASWPDEPVEADHVGSFGSLEEAQAECERYRRGGFDDFVIHETTREVWRRRTGGAWQCSVRARAS